MQPPKSTEPSAVTVRRAYKSPQLTRFGALRELTLGMGGTGICDNGGTCVSTKTS